MNKVLCSLSMVLGMAGAYGVNIPSGVDHSNREKLVVEPIMRILIDEAFDDTNDGDEDSILVGLASRLAPTEFAATALTLISGYKLEDRVDHLASVVTRLKSVEHAKALSSMALFMVSDRDAIHLEAELTREMSNLVVRKCLDEVFAPRVTVQAILAMSREKDRAISVASKIKSEKDAWRRETLLRSAIPMLTHKERIQLRDVLLAKVPEMSDSVSEYIDPILTPEAQVEFILQKWVPGDRIVRLASVINAERDENRVASLLRVIFTTLSIKERSVFINELTKKGWKFGI